MPDHDDLPEDAPALPSGEVALWIAVLPDAFSTLQVSGGYQAVARGWIEDPENVFFEALTDEVGYEPAGLRERIREALMEPQGQ